MYLVRQLWKGYRTLFVDFSDPRSNQWWMVSTPYPVMLLIASYVLFSKGIGPFVMARRKPIDVTTTKTVYNVLQIVGNAALLCYGLEVAYMRDDFNFWCQDISRPDQTNERGMEFVWGGVYYMILKVADLMDTVFFVLRKQNSHISFLHVYHHGIMIVTGYAGVRFLPGGNGVLLVCLNCTVHMFMYAYYLFSGLDSTRTAAARWKKTITQLQLLQFAILVVHLSNAFLDQSCTFPHAISMLLLLQNIFMTFMFSDFYWRTYVRKRPPKAVHRADGSNAIGQKIH